MVTSVAGANVGDRHQLADQICSFMQAVTMTTSREPITVHHGRSRDGMGTMQPCPSGPPTDTFTPTHTAATRYDLQSQPRNMAFDGLTFAKALVLSGLTSILQ